MHVCVCVIKKREVDKKAGMEIVKLLNREGLSHLITPTTNATNWHKQNLYSK